jgi:hypothetical protein
MKKLIVVLFIFKITLISAQNEDEKKVASSFIIERADIYVKKVKPIFIVNENELKKIEEKLDKNKISYRKYSFVFLGEIKEDNFTGGAMNSYTQDVRKPLLYYTIVKENYKTIIWVLSGHRGL